MKPNAILKAAHHSDAYNAMRTHLYICIVFVINMSKVRGSCSEASVIASSSHAELEQDKMDGNTHFRYSILEARLEIVNETAIGY